MSLPGDENPNPQWQRPPEPPRWTQGSPLGDQAEQPQWQQPPQEQQRPQWEQQQYPQWQSPPRTPGQAFAALILGIVGLVICPIIPSILAIVFGSMARSEIDRSGGQLGGSGIALTGLILGWVGVGLWVLFFLAVVAL
jgi:uncharacterized protein DUF4190